MPRHMGRHDDGRTISELCDARSTLEACLEPVGHVVERLVNGQLRPRSLATEGPLGRVWRSLVSASGSPEARHSSSDRHPTRRGGRKVTRGEVLVRPRVVPSTPATPCSSALSGFTRRISRRDRQPPGHHGQLNAALRAAFGNADKKYRGGIDSNPRAVSPIPRT